MTEQNARERKCSGHWWVLPRETLTFYVPDWGDETPDPRQPDVVCKECSIEYDRH